MTKATILFLFSLLLSGNASVTAARSSGYGAMDAKDSIIQTVASEEDGIVCDTTGAKRHKVLAQALGTLFDQYEIHEGNLSFHMGGNPAGKYGVVKFDEALIPKALKRAAKATAGFPVPIEVSFLMGPQDAVFWYGCTPPPTRYFSIRSYLAYRFPGEGRNISGYMPGAELGDPVNNAVIRTTGGPTDPFGKTTLFVSTGDKVAFHRVREAFAQAGLPGEAANLDVLPSELVRFRDTTLPWAVDRSDTIAWQFRVNEFINPAEGSAYLDKVWPVFLLRAKPSEDGRGDGGVAPAMPLTAPPLKTRGTGESEEWLRSALEKLVEAVKTRMEVDRGLVLTHSFPLAPCMPDAIRCISDLDYCPVAMPIPQWNLTACNPTCDWFTRDSLYSTPPADSDFINFMIPRDRVLIVVGVNHVLLGKAAFTNFLVTGIRNPERPGHTPNFSSSHLAGSGQYYLPGVRPESDFLYAQELSRDCGFPPRPFCELVKEDNIAYDEYLFFAERAYLEMQTTVGPSPDEVISPFILAFDPAADPLLTAVDVPEPRVKLEGGLGTGRRHGAAATLRGQRLSSMMAENGDKEGGTAEQ